MMKGSSEEGGMGWWFSRQPRRGDDNETLKRSRVSCISLHSTGAAGACVYMERTMRLTRDGWQHLGGLRVLQSEAVKSLDE